MVESTACLEEDHLLTSNHVDVREEGQVTQLVGYQAAFWE
jgi:hypothetical protein